RLQLRHVRRHGTGRRRIAWPPPGATTTRNRVALVTIVIAPGDAGFEAAKLATYIAPAEAVHPPTWGGSYARRPTIRDRRAVRDYLRVRASPRHGGGPWTIAAARGSRQRQRHQQFPERDGDL